MALPLARHGVTHAVSHTVTDATTHTVSHAPPSCPVPPSPVLSLFFSGHSSGGSASVGTVTVPTAPSHLQASTRARGDDQ